MPATVTQYIPGWQGFEVDLGVVLFAVVVAIVCGIVFGLAPALATVKIDVHPSLKEGQRSGGGGAPGMRARRGLVIAQVAVALVLVSGAGLVVQGFQRLISASPGFEPDGVLTLRVALPDSRYDTPERIVGYQRQALERLRAVPGVTAAAVGTRPPWTDWGGRGSAYPVDVSGATAARPEDRPRGGARVASDGYFETLGIPLLAGRAFEAGDVATSEPVAVVSRSLAVRLTPGGKPEDALGRLVRLDHPRLGTTWRRVVGVCGEVTHTWWETGPSPLCYLPFTQAPFSNLTIVLRTGGDPMAMAPRARAALLALDREQPVWGIQTLRAAMDEIFSPLRLSASMMTMFAVLAMLLATIGLYGLIAYSVSQRTHEIGVRLALGAQRRNVLALVVRQGLVLAGIGLLIGVPAAWSMGHFAASKLFGVVALDLGLLAGIAAALLLVALLASYLPARHASRVDPMVALRNE
jgi:putative ABC transport system permease protein